MKAKIAMLVMLLSVVPVTAFAQTEIPNPELPINFTAAHAVLILVGVFGGLTTAYLGSRKAKAQDPNYEFDIHKFLDRVIISVITSVGLAFTSAAGFVELNIVTIYLIYVGSLGTAELVLEVRQTNTGKATGIKINGKVEIKP